MTIATITVRLQMLSDLPVRLGPKVVAEAIETALRESRIKAACLNLLSHIKIDLPIAQLAAAVPVDLQLICGGTQSTRTQIAIQNSPEEWAHVFLHFDGYPAHMLPALARWKPEDILAAIEIRQVTTEALDCFNPPRDPRILRCPTREFAHLYMWIGCQWVHVVPQVDAPGV
jgi:hypothetical protein